jgi:hypothetical protein
MIQTCLWVCTKWSRPGLSSKAGTPVGQQRASRVNMALPASASSLAFLRASTTQGFRLGLLRSATRQFAFAPVRTASKLLT